MREYKLTEEGKLSSWNITDEDKAKGSKVVTRNRWGDGSEEFPTVGVRYPYDILVYGNVDDIENKFPESAEAEEPGDPDADAPVPVDASALIPEDVINNATSTISAIDTTEVTSALENITNNLTPVTDTQDGLKDAMDTLEELLAEAENLVGDQLNG